MVRAAILFLSLPMLAYCSVIPDSTTSDMSNGTVSSGVVGRSVECRTYKDCPICGFYERCCLSALGGGWCECGTSGRENRCE
ncbi:hypothetical protein GQ602_003732 [Ophiocordyceps camponoti-floridani]|uniref:Invertebrate defensins family profile domain-containing protein n=1 Tax=Ophiocordyceps camponoti-floridani TaxID=2030778 RepID=A0A8H4VEH4_9HYPO|nr:hypothetical protein GQ602_003732 [Ophiocordyceps camponoti-floridani]